MKTLEEAHRTVLPRLTTEQVRERLRFYEMELNRPGYDAEDRRIAQDLVRFHREELARREGGSDASSWVTIVTPAMSS